MERKITNELLKWKKDVNKKPLFLYGVPSCGKSYTVLEFARKEYKNVIYFNCYNNLELNYVFDKNNTLDKLIRGLSAISLETIFKEETLIVLDNVTSKIMDLASKLFSGVSYYPLIMISNNTSLLKKIKSDTFNVKKMTLVSFSEYLTFLGKDQMIDFIIDSFKNNKPMPFNSMALECFNDYVITGGYPRSIVLFRENHDYNLLSNIAENNIAILRNRLFDMDNLIDIKRGIEVYNNIPFQLLKENKKFMYGAVKTGGRAKEYESALLYMEKNNMLIKCDCVKKLTSPLSKVRDQDSFKLYYNDSGILYNKMSVSANRLLTNNKLLHILYENSICSTINQFGYGLYYYHSAGKAEIDLVMQTRTGKIVPIEVLSDAFSTKSKSMSLSLTKYKLDLGIRFYEGNFKMHNGIKYVPYYAAFCLEEL